MKQDAGIPPDPSRAGRGRPPSIPEELKEKIAAQCRLRYRYEVADEFGVARSTVTRICQSRGVISPKLSHKLADTERRAVAQMYKKGASLDDVAGAFNIRPPSVKGICVKAGVEIRPQGSHGRHRTLDESVLDRVSASAAYWIGWLMADGGICHDEGMQPRVTCTVAEIDRDHLVKMRDFFGSDHAITPYKSEKYAQSTYQFRSTKLVRRLASFGVVPRKSGSERVIGLEDNRHFWRGVVDGDGSLLVAQLPKRGRRVPTPSLSVVGSQTLMTQFRTFCKTHVSTNANVRSVPHAKNVFTFTLTTRLAVSIIRTLYRGALVGLDRKVLRAREILREFG